MFVTKKKYDEMVGIAEEALKHANRLGRENREALIDRVIHKHTEQHLRSAESALAYKDDVIEELQAEVYRLHRDLVSATDTLHDITRALCAR